MNSEPRARIEARIEAAARWLFDKDMVRVGPHTRANVWRDAADGYCRDASQLLVEVDAAADEASRPVVERLSQSLRSILDAMDKADLSCERFAVGRCGRCGSCDLGPPYLVARAVLAESSQPPDGGVSDGS